MYAARLIPLALVACTTAPATPVPAVIHKACTGFSPAVRDGMLRDHQLDEVSGLVIGTNNTRWVHNDSGDYPRVFALDSTGKTIAVLTLTGIDAVDWEDIARVPGADGSGTLYLADIGDNQEVRDQVQVHRIAETTTTAKVAPDSFALTYPDGPHNAETLLVDPRTHELVVVTKADDGRSGIYATSLPETPATLVLERVGEVVFPMESRGTEKTTAGDVSADGSRVAIRTYTDLWLWTRGTEPLSQALLGEPCRMPLEQEPQGEAIAWDGADLLTVSEGAGRPFWRYAAK